MNFMKGNKFYAISDRLPPKNVFIRVRVKDGAIHDVFRCDCVNPSCMVWRHGTDASSVKLDVITWKFKSKYEV